MRPIVHCQLINGPLGDPVMYCEIMFERRALLFDIGDITVLAPRQLLRVSHVFVSHTHMDHFAGFDHLLRLLLGRDKTVALYGPSGFIDRVEHKLKAYTWNVVRSYAGNLVLEAYEVQDNGIVHCARFSLFMHSRARRCRTFECTIRPGILRRLECAAASWTMGLLVLASRWRNPLISTSGRRGLASLTSTSGHGCAI